MAGYKPGYLLSRSCKTILRCPLKRFLPLVPRNLYEYRGPSETSFCRHTREETHKSHIQKDIITQQTQTRKQKQTTLRNEQTRRRQTHREEMSASREPGGGWSVARACSELGGDQSNVKNATNHDCQGHSGSAPIRRHSTEPPCARKFCDWTINARNGDPWKI